MTIIVNIFVLIILSIMLFTISHQGLVDLEKGLSGTIFFTSIIVIYLIAIFRMILNNIAAGKDHDSIKDFFSESWQTTFRGKPDLRVKAVSWLGTICWGLVITTLASIKEAAKTTDTSNIPAEDLPLSALEITWDSTWTTYAYVLTMLITFASAAGLILKSKRNQRKTDRYPLSLITMFIFSIISLIYFY
ncbi:MAG: hypothetical protein HQL70_05285 [Magnetococcales bacterium]|nr:hypothetical protein [Magnetococcales bacterium]